MQGVLTLIRTDAWTENAEIHAIQVALRLGQRESMSGYRSVSINLQSENKKNYVNPGSQIPHVEARKRCSRDLFTFSGRATALIDRHFWYTFLQQSMTRLTNTTILLTYTSHFHWRFTGNWQEHICEGNIRCFASPSHLSLGSDRLNVTVYRICTVLLWDVQRTVGIWYPWMAGVTFIKFLTWPYDCTKHQQMAESLLTASVDGRPTPQHPHPMLFDYNNFKVSKSPRTPTARTPLSLSGIQDTRAEPVPLRGCSEEFLFLIVQLEGINKGDLDVIETPEQAKTMYEALLPLISANDVDNI